MRLNRTLVIKRALALVNEIGFENLTTRRLGKELGVEGPALYRHFKSKSELVDHMAAAILLEVLRQPHPGEPWDEWLLGLGRASFDAVLKYRDGAKIVASALPTEPVDLLSKPLCEAGFSQQEAIYASKLFSSFMIGWQLREDNELHRNNRAEPEYNHIEAFEFALGSLIDGLRVRLKQSLNNTKSKTNIKTSSKTKARQTR